ncbi:TetR-like C-terminal domain-containing protein [Dactylosporangium matsuzakiense]|uniref:HTH-type transcriptional regulator MT1864/Rv1816-like C-terminal domain-containing protein n=1 Tax=Dactylosporangium matsuzakiense TaxID=53360 RepID=A0A9W6KCS9_9ACTN|nr:TetR-like C-terminal domain-containing protein [Dactylosporangium matsuzakiense]UWZ47048.1 WHG domain-containing protein [Dactylosporangium matsuzakiense]GLK98521.1 hypothetical protein GCM10017581_002620 [Dactylosporangium matsuzakiense]
MPAYHGYAIGHPHRYSLARQRPDATHPAAAAAASRILDVLVAVFKAYDLTDRQTVPATRVLRAAMHGFAVLHGAFQMVEGARTIRLILIETMKSIRVAAKIAS